MHTEREHLRTLAEEGFDLAAVHFPHVNASGCIRVLTNFYSVPLPVGVEVQVKVYSTYVEIWHQGQCVARHERCFDRQQKAEDAEDTDADEYAVGQCLERCEWSDRASDH
jgi:hypothetical protein